jgi:hypothetical protein
MKPFLMERKRVIDLIILLVIVLIIFWIWGHWGFMALFVLGYIWNWVAAQDLSLIFENRRYRFSTLKLVGNLQILFLKPFKSAPLWIRWIVGILPAGVLWSMIIYFNDSQMPWWATFLGSLTFEFVQLEKAFMRKHLARETST